MLGILFFVFSAYMGYIQYFIVHWLIFPYLILDTLRFINQENKDKKDTDKNITATNLTNYLRKWITLSVYFVTESITDYIFPYTPISFLYYFIKLFLLIHIISKPDNYCDLYDRIASVYNMNAEFIENQLQGAESIYQDYKSQLIQLMKLYIEKTKTMGIEIIQNLSKLDKTE